MITLYYIPGISAVDEPNPSTAEQQEKFFAKNKVISIDTGFYPPHYHNEILLSAEDVTFGNEFNYLSIDYNDRVYYYFIDNIEYISEDTMKVYVTLDTLQTYRFDIKFYNSAVNRLSIARWINGKINRNYIRTNRSHGTMEQSSIKYMSRDIGWYIIILNSASTLYTGEEGSRTVYSDSNYSGISASPLDSKIVSPLVNIIAIPVLLKSGFTKLKYGGVAYTTYSNSIRARMLGGINGVESITYYDYNVFNEYVVLDENSSTGVITITNKTNMRILHFWNLLEAESGQYADLGWLFAPINILNIPYYYTDISIPAFEASGSSSNLMLSRYVPAMLDENYIQVEFGERTGYATYPLHYLVGDSRTSGSLYGVCMINYIDGGRSYYITTDTSVDTYHTLITNTSIEQVALYNDAWQTYLSQNMCTLMRGRALSYQQIGYSSIRNNFKENSKMNELLYSEKGVSPENFYLFNAKKAINYAKYATDVSAQISLYDQSREIQEANIKAQPDSQKVGNSCASDCSSGILQVFQKVYKCSDFEDVAKDYEMNGYDVARHLNSNLFEYHVRHYYDIIRTDDITIALTDAPSDNFTISDIKNRFRRGVRLWHMASDSTLFAKIGDYTYDNVEMEDN